MYRLRSFRGVAFPKLRYARKDKRANKRSPVALIACKGYRVRLISLVDAGKLYEMRMLLEQACIERFCRAALDSELVTLNQCRIGPAGQMMQHWLAYVRDFHLALDTLSGNHRLTGATRNVVQEFERLLCASIASYGGGVERNRTHQRVVQDHAAIINGTD
jgi:DNA-binding GntR family transcriptional regulator